MAGHQEPRRPDRRGLGWLGQAIRGAVGLVPRRSQVTGQLRVEPAALKAVGSTIADIGTSLSGSDVGKSLASLAGVARGFRSGEAGAQIGSAIDTASKKVSAAFVDYADNLKAAAEKYEKT